MTEEIISKALEIWTLQTLLDISIILGLLTLGMVLIQPYYRSLREHLTLRVSIEVWDLFTTLFADLFLTFTVIIGFFVLNPDIMADIKVAVPFMPLATVLFALALLIRLLHGGHRIGQPAFRTAAWLLFFANLLNILGFALIMEAPGKEYLELHPSPFWTYLTSHFRSNISPHGIEMNQISFYIFFPILMAIFVYGFARTISKLNSHGETQE